MPTERHLPADGDLLDVVLTAATSLILVVDAEGRLVRWNRACERLSGYTAEELDDAGSFGTLFPEHERPRAPEVVERLSAGESPLACERHWRTRDGELRLIRWSTSALTGPSGRVTHLVSSGTDITHDERRLSERTLAEERLSLAFDHAPIGMALADTEGRLVRVNPALCEMTGYGEEELLSRTFLELTHPEDLGGTRQALSRAYAGERVPHVVTRYLRKNGRELWVEVHTSVVRDADGRPLHLLGQVVDITGSRHLEQRLRHLADHDSLTGLFNRRRLEEELERHVAHGRRYGMDGALLVLDLDGFKRVNDRYGHRAGDRALASVGAVLRSRLRQTDLVARFGGDEFAVLLPHGGELDAQRVAATLAEAVATEVTVPGGQLSASIGYALFDENVLSPDDVLSAADAAMYSDKDAGRAERPPRRRPD